MKALFGILVSTAIILASCGKMGGETRFQGATGKSRPSPIQAAPEAPADTLDAQPEVGAPAPTNDTRLMLLEKTFLANPITSRQVRATSQRTEIPIKLVRKESQRHHDFVQVNRPQITDVFTQGNSGVSTTDTFQQNQTTQYLDILIVVDNSGSMRQEQEKLAQKMEPLLSSVATANWRIGVVTTDYRNPCMRAVISKGDADAASAFFTAIDGAGTSGSAKEEGIRQALAGLQCPTKWLRTGSSVAVIILSDEDESGTTTPDQLIAHLNDIRNVPTSARTYGLLNPNNSVKYRDLISRTNGTWGDILAADYTSTLESISLDMKGILKDQFTLTHAAAPGTAVVKVNGIKKTSGFSLVGKALNFTVPPPIGSTITVEYRYNTVPIKTNWSLSQPAVVDTAKVFLNGALQPAGSYVMTANAISFVSAPPENSSVKVVFRKNIPLQQSFPVAQEIKPGSLTATVNGVAANVTQNASGAILNPVAPDGAAIAIDYIELLAPQLEYNVAYGDNPRNIEIIDGQTGKPFAARIVDTGITVLPEDFADGKEILVAFQNDDMKAGGMTLEGEPLEGSLKIVSDAGTTCAGDSYELLGTQLHLWCNFGDGVGYSVEYRYSQGDDRSFTLPEATDPDNMSWMVWLNGTIATDFVRKGNTITFDSALAPGSEVRVSASTRTDNE